MQVTRYSTKDSAINDKMSSTTDSAANKTAHDTINDTTKLANLKDLELNEKIKTLAAQERKLTQVILLHIAEVDRRKLFLRKAYPSLFEYLVQEIGYSAGAAQRRIDAARLLQRVPEVSRQIETGAIHLSQISKMQKICRQIKKESGQSVQPSVQKEVLQKLENQNSAQTDLILAREFQIEIKIDEKKVTQRDESVRVELTFTKDEMELMRKAQELLSNKTGGAFKNTLLEMAQRTINSYRPKSTRVRESKSARKSAPVHGSARGSKRESAQEPIQESAPRPTQKSVSEATDVGATVAVKTVLVAETSLAQAAETSAAPENSATPKPNHLKPTNEKPSNSSPTTQKTQENQKTVTLNSVTPILVTPKQVIPKPATLKSVTLKLKREILHRDQCCQFKDADTGRVCGAKLFLEIDHIRPRFARGENTAENLRTLCKNHNMFRYQQGL